MTLRVSPEEALLIEAACGRRVVEVAGDPSTIDAQRLLELAHWHRVVPLLWEHVRDHIGEEHLPDELNDHLRQAARDALARNLELEIERDRILELLAAEDIPVVLLKGAALVDTVYDHAGQRPMADLDLLVPNQSIRRAHALVEHELGYQVYGASLGRDDEQRLRDHHHHFPLLKHGGQVMVELHHRLFDDRPDYEVESLWARAMPAAGPPPRLLPAPEDLFLHVAVHFAFDRIHRGESALSQLADIARVAARWPLDFDAVARRATDNGVRDRLFLALAAAVLLIGDVAPPEITAALTPASYTDARGETFVRQRVLRLGPALPLEQLTSGRRRILTSDAALEQYIRPGEPVAPTRSRLRLRRYAALASRLRHELPNPRALIADVRLSRWMLTLRS
jgi:hypothetical protein